MEKNKTHNHEEEHDISSLSERFLTHANFPNYQGALADANGWAKGVGTCGDTIEIFLSVNGKKINNVSHVPVGCAYTTACGSAVSTLVKGCSLEEALAVTAQDVAGELDGLPEDHMHCAALAVNTLGEAIDDYYQKIWGKKQRKKA